MNAQTTRRCVSFLGAVIVVTACGSSAHRRDLELGQSPPPERRETSAAQRTLASSPDALRAEEVPFTRSPTASLPMAAPTPPTRTPRLCVRSWEERPGTADYTTLDVQLASRGLRAAKRFDRPQALTLRGWKAYDRLSACERARVLKPCFEKAVLRSSDWGARRFREWARGRVEPVRAHIALAEQETRLGGLDDVCVRGVCNGVGLLQIISAFGADGAPLAHDAPEWDGITHNVLTNITYSARVLASKLVHEPEDLAGLASLYNGNPTLRAAYAERVVESYEGLKGCPI